MVDFTEEGRLAIVRLITILNNEGIYLDGLADSLAVLSALPVDRELRSDEISRAVAPLKVLHDSLSFACNQVTVRSRDQSESLKNLLCLVTDFINQLVTSQKQVEDVAHKAANMLHVHIRKSAPPIKGYENSPSGFDNIYYSFVWSNKTLDDCTDFGCVAIINYPPFSQIPANLCQGKLGEIVYQIKKSRDPHKITLISSMYYPLDALTNFTDLFLRSRSATGFVGKGLASVLEFVVLCHAKRYYDRLACQVRVGTSFTFSLSRWRQIRRRGLWPGFAYPLERWLESIEKKISKQDLQVSYRF